MTPTPLEQCTAEAVAHQFTIAVLLSHMAPPTAEQVANRINESEFAEYLQGALSTLPTSDRKRLISVAKEALEGNRDTCLIAGNTRPWLLTITERP